MEIWLSAATLPTDKLANFLLSNLTVTSLQIWIGVDVINHNYRVPRPNGWSLPALRN
jgi:hypothetical protein